MVKRKGTNGDFWGCNNYPKCKTSLQDKDGKPDYEGNGKKKPQKTDFKCKQCDEGYLVKRIKKSDKSIFWGCNMFPKCKNIVSDNNGKPEGY